MPTFDRQDTGNGSTMFTIGEFSQATGLTVKTLRFYHEAGVLTPSHVDPQTGYRYYAGGQVETARAIAFLRSLEFSLSDVQEILRQQDSGESILAVLRRQRNNLQEKLKQLRKTARSLDQFIASEQEMLAVSSQQYDVEEKVLPACLVAGIRMVGRYQDCGQAFGQIGRRLGRHLGGKPMLLHYDAEYKEADADFEACFPVRANVKADGIAVRELPGGRCVALVHLGPYDQLGRSYARILQYLKEKGYKTLLPTREVYLKGPGMIFKGNPKHYLTEIQFLIDENA